MNVLDKFIIIDTETTGLSPYTERIIEIGAIKIENGQISDTFREYVNPKRPIPLNITNLTGISDAMVKNASLIDEVLQRFIAFAGEYIVIAHNAKFDMDFINGELRRCDAEEPFNNNYIDSLEISRYCYPEAPNHKLATLCAFLKLNAKNSHNVIDDCKCVYELMKKLCVTLDGKGQGLSDYVQNGHYSTPKSSARSMQKYYKTSMAKTTVYTEAHKKSPQIYNRYELSRRAAEIRPQKYEQATFTKPRPEKCDVMHSVVTEAERNVTGLLFRQKKIDEYVKSHIEKTLEVEQAAWERERELFCQSEAEKEVRKNIEYEKEAQEAKRKIALQISAKEDYIISHIEEILHNTELPFLIKAGYNIDLAENSVWLDLNLPDIECIPATKPEYGSLIEKKKTQKEIKFEYVQFAFSASVYIASLIFSITPKIQQVILSARTPRRNKIGDLVDEYILSLKFTRAQFETADWNNIQPQEFCMQFENRCNITATGIMKPIKPYQQPTVT